MKPGPLFLLGMTLMALCGPAAAQTMPPPAPNTPPGKEGPRPKRAAPPRTASVWAVKMDTAAFRRSERPADHILLHARPQDIPRSVPSKK